MSSMIALGIPLEKVVPMVTSNNPARMLGRADEIGAIKVGREADNSVLSQQTGRFILRDNEKNEGDRRAAAATHVLPARGHTLRRGGPDPAAGGGSVNRQALARA